MGSQHPKPVAAASQEAWQQSPKLSHDRAGRAQHSESSEPDRLISGKLCGNRIELVAKTHRATYQHELLRGQFAAPVDSNASTRRRLARPGRVNIYDHNSPAADGDSPPRASRASVIRVVLSC
jgi:hypothetical protein